MQTVREGKRLSEEVTDVLVDHQSHGFRDRTTVHFQLAMLLEKIERACVLLEHGAFFDRANAHRQKGSVQADLGQLGEAMATLQEARQLYSMAARQGDANTWEVEQNSLVALCDVADLLKLNNQFAESEKYYYEVLSAPRLDPLVRMQCVNALAVLNNQRKNWGKGAEFCKQALALLPKAGSSKYMFTIQIHLHVILGDAMEGQGEWARALEYDKKALAMWEQTEVRSRSASTILSATRRAALQLLREGNPVAAARRLAAVPRVYAGIFAEIGINYSHMGDLNIFMAALKVWAEACFLAAPRDEESSAYVN